MYDPNDPVGVENKARPANGCKIKIRLPDHNPEWVEYIVQGPDPSAPAGPLFRCTESGKEGAAESVYRLFADRRSPAAVEWEHIDDLAATGTGNGIGGRLCPCYK